ncbi:MAG TPA: AIM24 family protein, partial [Vicinamibacterales bacterium]|nr:AIM24 family protein [Vicinamibacterales bacterium]
MSDDQWFMAIGGHQVGPVSRDDVVTNLRNGTIDGNTLIFGPGLTNWTPLKDVPQLASYLTGASGAPRPAAPPPIVPGRRAHEIDFKIIGSEMQFVEVELDPGESAVAEAGSMMYMTPGITMETVFGDGAQQKGGGVMGALLGAGKRLITGESLFMTVFTNGGGGGKQQVSFAAPYPEKILAMDLKQLGGQLICQKDSFLCAARGVSIGIAFQRRIGVGLFGGEGFIMQKLEGDGLCFVHAGGTVHPLDLGPGQTLRVDTGCL